MSKKLYSITFLFLLFFLPILHIALPDKGFSPLENRNLAKVPKPEVKTILDGSFKTDTEEYMADQFPFRNQFLSFKLYAEVAEGKRESNGVFLGKDGQLLQHFETPDFELLQKNASYINALGEEAQIWFLLAPTATGIYEEKLPRFAPGMREDIYMEKTKEVLSEKIRFVDVFDTLKQHKEEEIYYKTDHHWTMLGAFYAYQSLCAKMGLVPKNLDEFERKRVSGDFYGSLYSKGNIVFAGPDSIDLFYPKEEISVTVENLTDGSVSDSLYEMEYLEQKDKYSLFLDNNQPLLRITSSVKNGKRLAVVKDSYANCLIPFLTAHFEEIYVLDLRYLNFSAGDYIEEKGIEKILLLYNVQSFAADTGLQQFSHNSSN